MALTKLSAGGDAFWLLNDVPHQRGQFDVSARIGQDVVEIYSLNTLKSLARGKYDEFSPDGITPYASTQALIDDLKTFFFRSVAGGGGAVDSVNGETGTVLINTDNTPNQSIVPGATASDALNRGWQEITEAASTGVVSGLLLTVDLGGLAFSIGVGEYHVVKDSAPNVIDDVAYAGSVGNTLPSLAVDTQYYVFIDETEALTYQTSAPLPNDYKEKALIGALIVVGGQIINFSNLQVPVTDLGWRIKNLTNAIGLINARGNVISNGGTDLGIAKTQGYLHTYRDGRDGIDQGSYADIPLINTSGVSTDRFILISQNAIVNPSAQFLDVGNYDNNGVITPIGGGSNSAANWFVYIFPDAIVVVYPQRFYATLAEAETNIDKDAQDLIVSDLFTTSGFPLGVFTVDKSATDLSNTSEATFKNGSKFGEFIGGGAAGGQGVTILQGFSTALNAGGDLSGNTKYTLDIAVTGAVIGDKVDAGLSDLLANDLTVANIRPTYYAWVVSENTVRVAISTSSFLSGNVNYTMWCRVIK